MSSPSSRTEWSGVEPGFRVVEEDMESSVSEVLPEEGEWDRTLTTFGDRLSAESRLTRMLCTMCDSENGRCWVGIGFE